MTAGGLTGQQKIEQLKTTGQKKFPLAAREVAFLQGCIHTQAKTIRSPHQLTHPLKEIQETKQSTPHKEQRNDSEFITQLQKNPSTCRDIKE